MRRKLSDQEFHALYCPVKNPKSALFLVAYFSVAAFGNWKGLHKAPEHLDLVSLSFIIIVVAMLAKSLINFTCFRERLVFVLVIVSFVTGEVYGFFPAIVGPYAHVMELGRLALSLLGLLVSVASRSSCEPDHARPVGPESKCRAKQCRGVNCMAAKAESSDFARCYLDRVSAWAGGPDVNRGDELGCPTRRVYVWGFWLCFFLAPLASAETIYPAPATVQPSISTI